MGYYANYTLTISDVYEDAIIGYDSVLEEKIIEILRKLGEISGLYDPNSSEEDILNFFDQDITNWHSPTKDMRKLSTFYPEFWFVLEAHGEAWDYTWKEMYHNGMYEHCDSRIVFKDFSPKKDWNEINEKENELWMFEYVVGVWVGDEYSVEKGFTCATTCTDAIGKLADYYGEQNISDVRCLMPVGSADATDADVIANLWT